MKYIRLSQTIGLKVSVICLGTWHLPRKPVKDEFGAFVVDVDETKKVLKRAYDLGINFIDTANRYHGGISPVPLTHVGYAERILGLLIKELGIDRESLVIASKVGGQMANWPNGGGLSRKHVMWQIAESLKRLQTDYVDIYYMHLFDPETPKYETISTFNDLVRRGLVRYIGVSNIPAPDLVEYQMIAEKYGFEPIAVLQYKYNWLERSIEGDIIPVAKRFGLGLTAYSPLAQGVLTGKYIDTVSRSWIVPPGSRGEYFEGVRKLFTDTNLNKVLLFVEFARSKNITPAQLALSWIFRKSEELGITIVPVVGVSNVHQLEEAVDALDITLSEDDMKYLDEIWQGAKT